MGVYRYTYTLTLLLYHLVGVNSLQIQCTTTAKGQYFPLGDDTLYYSGSSCKMHDRIDTTKLHILDPLNKPLPSIQQNPNSFYIPSPIDSNHLVSDAENESQPLHHTYRYKPLLSDTHRSITFCSHYSCIFTHFISGIFSIYPIDESEQVDCEAKNTLKVRASPFPSVSEQTLCIFQDTDFSRQYPVTFEIQPLPVSPQPKKLLFFVSSEAHIKSMPLHLKIKDAPSDSSQFSLSYPIPESLHFPALDLSRPNGKENKLYITDLTMVLESNSIKDISLIAGKKASPFVDLVSSKIKKKFSPLQIQALKYKDKPVLYYVNTQSEGYVIYKELTNEPGGTDQAVMISLHSLYPPEFSIGLNVKNSDARNFWHYAKDMQFALPDKVTQWLSGNGVNMEDRGIASISANRHMLVTEEVLWDRNAKILLTDKQIKLMEEEAKLRNSPRYSRYLRTILWTSLGIGVVVVVVLVIVVGIMNKKEIEDAHSVEENLLENARISEGRESVASDMFMGTYGDN